MKGKTKKILAGIGMGAVLGTSGLFMAGCSMTDEQQKALDSIVNKVDDVIELVENQNRELDYIEATRLFNYAKMRLSTNKDNVWDNLIIHQTISTNEDTEIFADYNINKKYHSYKFSDGKRVAYSFTVNNGVDGDIDADGYFNEVIGQTGVRVQAENPPTEILPITITYSAAMSITATTVIGGLDLNEDGKDIVDCYINDNGNYCITALAVIGDDEGCYPSLIDMEITKDGYLLSYRANLLMKAAQGTYNYCVMTTRVTYQYGVLTDSIVQANIDKYEDQN